MIAHLILVGLVVHQVASQSRRSADFASLLAQFRLSLSPIPLSQFHPHFDPAPEDSAFQPDKAWPEPECKKVPIKYTVDRILTPHHSRSRLHLVHIKSTSEPAVRKIHGSVRSFQAEIDFYRKVTHPLVAKALCWDRNTDVNIQVKDLVVPRRAAKVFEYHDKGLLLEFVNGGQSGDWLYEIGYRFGRSQGLALLKTLFGQLIDAIVHVHSSGLVHGDLKPENIMISLPASHVKGVNTTFVLKLIDFDLSAPVNRPRMRSGTRTTMSPEVATVIPGPVNEASDWWSVGVTLLMWMGAWRCGEEEALGKGQLAGRLCSYRPFLFNRDAGKLEIRSLPEGHGFPDDLLKACYLLLDVDPKRRRFVHPDDLSFLRNLAGVTARKYHHLKAHKPVDPHDLAVADDDSPYFLPTYLTSAHNDTAFSHDPEEKSADSEGESYAYFLPTYITSNNETAGPAGEDHGFLYTDDIAASFQPDGAVHFHSNEHKSTSATWAERCDDEECVRRERQPMINRKFKA